MKSSPKILGVITARGGSKGIPGKNIKLLGGKPLIAYTIETAKKSKLLTHLIVSTDDEKIAQVCRDFGAEVPFIRPAELAADKAPHLPVMQHAVQFMEKREGVTFDYVVILQPTSPFRTVEDLDGTLQKLIDTGADSAVSISEMPSQGHPIKAKKLEGDRLLAYCIPEVEGTRRQDLPTAYRRNGIVYSMRRDTLMKDNRLYGENVVGYVTAKERAVDIDVPLDWIVAEYVLEELKKKGNI
jgi:CMP-N,N'-diacetyllegionaminic acid synthase